MNAKKFATLAELAYQDAETIKEAVSIEYDKFKFIESGDTQVFVAGNDDEVVVSFRGTESFQDWLTDAKFRMVDSAIGKIHRGFTDALYEVFNELVNTVEEFLDDEQYLYITGHSLGGALATLFAIIVDEDLDGVYTFGSPRVGNRAFKKAYDSKLKGISFRYVNNNDIVTRVPFWLFGYRHVGLLRYLASDGVTHQKISSFGYFLDRLRGRAKDFGNKGTDGIKDHAIGAYIIGLMDINNAKP